MRFELGRELRSLGLLDRDEILDPQRVEHLPAEAFGDDAGADALARRVDRRRGAAGAAADDEHVRSEEHTSELQSLMRISYAVFCLKKKKQQKTHQIILSNTTAHTFKK